MAATPQMKKPTQKPTYREALDGLLKAIDDAPIAPDHPIFKKWDDMIADEGIFPKWWKWWLTSIANMRMRKGTHKE